ncbi:tetratricopeptide repeat protein [Paenibacillus sp. RC67]|uniref:tetratricopeptide repeat protein n=1 Tax=Paenibacillus sp. RC67 TaxID=3039392 RepID=UPI0024ADC2BA|nr:tetratricopeptide repeat protein [Paenibacillus sp. RC67]
MISVGATVGAIIRGSMTLWNKMKNPQSATLSLIVKSLNKGASHYREYLSTKTEQDGIQESVYWEEKGLKQFFEKEYSENKRFGFHTYDAKKLANEIEQYFILSNHNLTEYEKISFVEKVISYSQSQYILAQTNENKSMALLQLRGELNVEQILQVVSQLPSIQKDVESIKQKLITSEHSQANEVVKDFTYYYTLCIELYTDRNYPACLSLIQEAITTHLSTEQYISLLFFESSIYYNQFNYDLALECILRIEDRINNEISDAFTASILANKGSIYSEKGAMEGNKKLVHLAIECFEKQLHMIMVDETNNKSLGRIYYNLGTSYLSIIETQNDIDSCIEYFELAFEMLPENAEVMKNLGTAYGMNHQHEKEIEMYELALDANPELFEALCALGMVYYRYYHNPEEASKYFQKAVRQRLEVVRFPYVYYWLGKCYFETDHKEKARAAIEEGLRIAPTLEYLIELKSDILYSLLQDKPQTYLSEFTQFINRMYPVPTEESSSKLLAALLLNAKYEEAYEVLSTLSESIKESVSLMPSYFMWAFNLINNNDFEGAYQIINNINPKKFYDEINSFKYVYHFIIALSLSGLQRHEEAVVHLEAIHVEDSIFQPVETHCLLGSEFLEIEEYDTARVHFQKAKGLMGEENTNMDIEYGLFQAYLGLERVRPAKASIFKMIDLLAIPYVGNILTKEINPESTLENRMSEIFSSMTRLALLEVRLKIKDNKTTVRSEDLEKEMMRHSKPLLQYFSEKITGTAFNFDKITRDYFLSKIEDIESNVSSI